MPELGKYADTVLSAYAVSLALLFGIVAISLWQSRKARARLDLVERRQKKDG